MKNRNIENPFRICECVYFLKLPRESSYRGVELEAIWKMTSESDFLEFVLQEIKGGIFWIRLLLGSSGPELHTNEHFRECDFYKTGRYNFNFRDVTSLLSPCSRQNSRSLSPQASLWSSIELTVTSVTYLTALCRSWRV